MNPDLPGGKRKLSPARDNDAHLLQLLSQGTPSSNPDLIQMRGKKHRKLQAGSGDTNASLQRHTGTGTGQDTTGASGSTRESFQPPSTVPSLPRPSQVLKAALGQEKFMEARSAILRHQELFLGQLYDLHHTVSLQRHLVSICGQRQAMHAELAKLEAEQDARLLANSDVTVEQSEELEKAAASLMGQGSMSGKGVGSNNQPPNPSPNAAGSSQLQAAEPGGDSSPKPTEPQNSTQNPFRGHQNPGGVGSGGGGQRQGMPEGGWHNMFSRGYPMQYGQPGMGVGGFPGWGVSPMMGGGFAGGGGGSGGSGGGFGGGMYSNMYGMPMGMMGGQMDPMMAWYALHYGQYAQAMQNQANAADAENARLNAAAKAAAEKEQGAKGEGAANEGAAGGHRSLRWWHDPEKVFGVAADPAVVGNVPSNHEPSRRKKSSKKSEAQNEVTSKPPEQQRPQSGAQGGKQKGSSLHQGGSLHRGSSAHNPASVKGSGSNRSDPKGSHQKAGSGVSAFKKLQTKSPNVRRPPTRAESIGSEVSRSGAEISPADQGESSGVAGAQGNTNRHQ